MCVTPQMRLGFGHVFGFRICLDTREHWANARRSGGFGTGQLSGKQGKKRKCCKAGVEELEPRKQDRVCSSFVSPRVPPGGMEDSHGVSSWLMDGYDVFVVNIYSCDRR